MGDTPIEWTNKSWNPIAAYYKGKRGWMCSKPSAGCKNCYSERLNLRLGNGLRYTPANVGEVDWRLVNLDEPLRWRKPQMVFVCSMTDLFHEAIPFKFIAAVFGVMMATKQHTYQVLTKRPERAVEFFRWLSTCAAFDGLTECEGVEQFALQHIDACHLQADTSQWPLPNVWIGVSAEDQEQADKRIPELLKIPARVRFLSVEPLLGPIDLTRIATGHWSYGHVDVMSGYLCGDEPDEMRDWDADPQGWIRKPAGEWERGEHGIDWVIVGGESGPRARPIHPEWARSLRDQCKASGVAYFFKQWGEYVDFLHCEGWNDFSDKQRDNQVFLEGTTMIRVGKKAAGRMLDGVEHNAFPEVANAH